MSKPSSSKFLADYWFPCMLVQVVLFQSLAVTLRIGMTYVAVGEQMGAFWVGVIGGVFGLLPAALALPLGRFIDRLGERAALVLSSVIMVVSVLGLLMLAPTLGVLLGMSVLLGIGQFLGVAAQQSATARASVGNSSASFGWMTLGVALAQTLGPLIVGWYADGKILPDTQGIFLASLWVSLLAVAVAACVMPPAAEVSERRANGQNGLSDILAIEGFVTAAVISVVVLATLELLVIYLPLFGAERGIDATTMGILLAIRGGSSAGSRFLFGVILNWLGRRRLLMVCLVGSGLSLALLPLLGHVVPMGICLAFLGFTLGVGAPLTLTWLAEIVPPEMRGAAFSLRLSMNRLGQFALPVAAGTILGAIGVAGVLEMAAAALLGAAIIVFRLRRLQV